jgi:TatD DNase family protein
MPEENPEQLTPHFFDIHSHLNFPEYDQDREAVIERMRQAGTWTITVGTGITSSRIAVEQTDLYEGLFACVGLHPDDYHDEEFKEENYEYLLKNPKVVAIGECGLDYARLPADPALLAIEKKRQKDGFEHQLEFAVRHEKPIMVHCRNSSREALDAQNDILDLLESKKKGYGDRLWGNAHFFSGPVEIARRYLDIGFSLSFTGVITFTADYDEALRFTPQESLMSETDAPFVAPVPYRGGRNEPVYVEEVAKRMALVRNEDLETLKKALVSNALRIFRIPSPKLQ